MDTYGYACQQTCCPDNCEQLGRASLSIMATMRQFLRMTPPSTFQKPFFWEGEYAAEKSCWHQTCLIASVAQLVALHSLFLAASFWNHYVTSALWPWTKHRSACTRAQLQIYRRMLSRLCAAERLFAADVLQGWPHSCRDKLAFLRLPRLLPTARFLIVMPC